MADMQELLLFLTAVWQVGRERGVPDLVEDVLAHFEALLREASGEGPEVDLRDETLRSSEGAEPYVCDWGMAER